MGTSISLGNHTTQQHQKLHLKISRRLSLAKEFHSFHLSGNKQDCLHLKDYLKYKCEVYLEQPLIPTQCKIIVAYRTSNHKLAIEIKWWLTIPLFGDNRLYHFCSYNTIENETRFVLECPLEHPHETGHTLNKVYNILYFWRALHLGRGSSSWVKAHQSLGMPLA